MLRICREGNIIRQHIAIAGNKIAVGIDLKGTIPGIASLTIRQLNLKEALSLNHQVSRIVRSLGVALHKNPIGSTQA